MQALLDKIIARPIKMLTRQGYLIEDQGMTYLAEIGHENPLKPLQGEVGQFERVMVTARMAVGVEYFYGRCRARQAGSTLSPDS